MTDAGVGVRLAGRGGQGIMLAAFLLAQAALTDGLHVVQTQSYGPEARLGAAKSDVIISPEPIAYPEIVAADILVCLSRDARDAYARSLRKGGASIFDERAVHDADVPPGALVVPLTRTATETGSPLATNVVALGVLVAAHRIVSERSLRQALASRISPSSLALNTAAFEAGLELAAARV